MNGGAKIWEIEIIKSKTISLIIGIISFVALTALGAWVRIPIPGTPVPITLQTMFVLLGGAILGGYGGGAQLIYIILGTLGLPIFACGLGLLGPTGGYLIGFIVSAMVVGTLMRFHRQNACDTKHTKNLGWIVLSMAIGTLIIYLFGVLQLGLFLGNGFKKAVLIGVLPFIPGDIIKFLTVSLIYYKFQARFNQLFG